jgi:ATP-dependent DNA helicase RecQ
VDRKLSLDDIAKLTMEPYLKKWNKLFYSGTKLNIKYWIDEMLDDNERGDSLLHGIEVR